MALLTGLGGSLWLRALWMLPISVCELECDRPSKYGLDKEGIDVISKDPQYTENEVQPTTHRREGSTELNSRAELHPKMLQVWKSCVTRHPLLREPHTHGRILEQFNSRWAQLLHWL